MTDYFMGNVYIIWFLTCLSTTWWYHFFIESIVFKNFYLYHIIFHLLSTSQVNIRDQYHIQYYHSKVLHSAFRQFYPEFLTVICNSIIYDYTSSAILHVLESCYTYVITLSWWCVGTWSWLTSFVLVLFRSIKRWISSSRPNYILLLWLYVQYVYIYGLYMAIHWVTNYYMMFLTIWKAGETWEFGIDFRAGMSRV